MYADKERSRRTVLEDDRGMVVRRRLELMPGALTIAPRNENPKAVRDGAVKTGRQVKNTRRSARHALERLPG